MVTKFSHSKSYSISILYLLSSLVSRRKTLFYASLRDACRIGELSNVASDGISIQRRVGKRKAAAGGDVNKYHVNVPERSPSFRSRDNIIEYRRPNVPLHMFVSSTRRARRPSGKS